MGYSSRTRLTTDRHRQLHALRLAADRLAARRPEDRRDDPDLAFLRRRGRAIRSRWSSSIHRKQSFEGSTKDYGFSRLFVRQHWAEGAADVGQSPAHPAWTAREAVREGLQVFDFGAEEVGRHES